MWKRNLLFIALCLAGLAAVSASLLSSNRVPVERDARHMAPRDDMAHVVQQVNDEFSQHWQQHGLTPAPAADHLAVIRRLALALTGATPSYEELRALEKIDPAQRIDWWVDHLLKDQRFADHVGERLARAYVGTDQGPFLLFRRGRFRNWISQQLQKNRRYDDLVRTLISDTGLWTSNPAVNFVTATLEEGKPNAVRLAARTSRAFLGMRIDCLQCHDDQLGELELGEPSDKRLGTQQDFHQLAAFFCEANVSLQGIQDGKGVYNYKYLSADEEVEVPPATPYLGDALPDGASADGASADGASADGASADGASADGASDDGASAGASLADAPLRRQLAAWVTSPQNRPFARAAVNRIWALMYGRPLHSPIDNIPLNGPFPPGMETLADDFIEHQFDLRRLIRVIAALRPFQLDGRADFELTKEHQRHWASFPLTRLRPEQVAGSIVQACSLEALDVRRHVFVKLKTMIERSQFVERYGDTGEDEFQERAGTVPQRLVMMNGDLVTERIGENLLFNAASRIAALAPDDQRAVETAYLCILTRRPSPRELEHFVDALRNTSGNRRLQSLEDLCWVLLNSTEFSWNH